VHFALFQGPNTLRDPSERVAFWLTALCAFPAALLIGYLLHESIGVSQVALFIAIAMIYVTLARGKLLGSSVRIHAAQYPRVFEIVKRTCAALDIPMPLIFVREDNYVPVVALGFGEPYSLVLSSHWIEAFEDDELAFMVGRELGHIAAGHTRYLSLLSVNGNENALISLIFGAWLRRCTFTCDKVGLLCCGSIDAAIRAMGVAAFHHFGRKIDYAAFAEQSAEIAGDPVLRWGAWLGSEPYATLRIASLRRFAETHAFAMAEEWFLRERGDEPPALPAPGTTTVVDKDCAGWWRRGTAYVIDCVVVVAIIGSFGGTPVQINSKAPPTAPVQINVNEATSPSPSPFGAASAALALPAALPSTLPSEQASTLKSALKSAFKSTLSSALPSAPPLPKAKTHFVFNGADVDSDDDSGDGTESAGTFWSSNPVVWMVRLFARLKLLVWLPVYLAILVAVAGQSFGMMICGLRVVTIDFRRPGIWRTIFRYVIEGALWWLIVPLSLVWRRVLLHDRFTATRVVKVERILARTAGTLTG
jgi:hypothetical protein